MISTSKDRQYYKFCLYGFLKNLRFFDAFFILFLLEKGLSYSQIGILYALREISVNLSEVPSGILADSYGRKRALLFSFFLYILSFGIFYISSGFWFFVLAFVFYGMADAFRSGTHKGMIMDYLQQHQWSDQKVHYYGHTRACSQRGSALASLIAGAIVYYYGAYHTIFLFSMIPYALNFLLIVSYPGSLNSSHSKKAKKENPFKQTWDALWQIMKRPKVLKLVNSAAMYTGYQKAIKDYIQPLMLQVVLLIPLLSHVEITKKNGLLIGVFYFFIYLLNAKASRIAGKIQFKYPRNITRNTLLAGLFLGLLSGVFYLNKLWVLALLIFIGVYLVENIRKPILTGLLSDSIPNEILTSVLSVQSLWRTIISVVLSLALGFLSDYFNIGIAFLMVSGLLLLFSWWLGKYSIQ